MEPLKGVLCTGQVKNPQMFYNIKSVQGLGYLFSILDWWSTPFSP